MFELITFLWTFFVQGLGLFIAVLFTALFIYLALHRTHSERLTILLAAVFIGVLMFIYVPNSLPKTVAYPFFLTTFGPSIGPVLPLSSVLSFVGNFSDFPRVEEIAADPSNIPPPIERSEPATIEIEMTTKEVIAEMAPGVFVNYWTFDGQVPGPFLRVRQGDTVVFTLHNDSTSLHHHSIDLHAVTGPGGGAVATMVAPGESKTFTFKAMHPGLFAYHCAEPNVANHMTHGMYGLMLVEPEEGMERVDKEFYVMQGEFYTAGNLGRKGLQLFDANAMLESSPQYIVFNGRTKALTENMSANVGERVRMYVGNGGVNLASNFHVIGEVFDSVYREGDLVSAPGKSIQTTLVPAGSSAMVEFGVEVPGNYPLVDHALARTERGAWGVLSVIGVSNPEIFSGEIAEDGHSHGH